MKDRRGKEHTPAWAAGERLPHGRWRLAVYYLLQCTWGILQNVLGLLLFLALLARRPGRLHGVYRGAFITEWNARGSMGLGMFLFFGHAGARDETAVLHHEYGHTLQSAVLGPLFLPVVGIPSFLWSMLPAFHAYRRKHRVNYYSLYCEAWASRWGERAIAGTAPKE